MRRRSLIAPHWVSGEWRMVSGEWRIVKKNSRRPFPIRYSLFAIHHSLLASYINRDVT